MKEGEGDESGWVLWFEQSEKEDEGDEWGWGFSVSLQCAPTREKKVMSEGAEGGYEKGACLDWL